MLLSKNKKFFAGVVSLFLLFVLILPLISSATLINCSLSTTTGIIGNDAVGGGCDFKDLIFTINEIIKWIIGIAGVIFTISAIYGGFLYMTSGDNPGNKSKAKSILWSTLIGFVIILTAWLIVYTILNYLVDNNSNSNSIFNFLGGR